MTDEPERDLNSPANQNQANPESPDLAELLLQRGLLEARDVELARHYQKRLTARGYPNSMAKILVELSLVDPYTLSQILLEEKTQQKPSPPSAPETNQPAPPQNQASLSSARWMEIALQTLQQLVAAPNLFELLHHACNLLLQYFAYEYAALYLYDEPSQSLLLQQQAPAPGEAAPKPIGMIPLSSPSPLSWSARTRQVYLSINDNFATSLQPGAPDGEDHLQACVPMIADGNLLGIIVVRSAREETISPPAVDALQAIAGCLASLVRQHRTLEATREILGELSAHYQISQGYAQAKTVTEVHRHTVRTLKQLPCHATVLFTQKDLWQEYPESEYEEPQNPLLQALRLQQLSPAWFQDQFRLQDHLLIRLEPPPSDLAPSLITAVADCGYQEAAFIPLRDEQRLMGMMIIGSEQKNRLDQKMLQYCVGLAELASSSLARAQALENMQRQLERLQVLDSVSQTIAAEIDLEKIYTVLHQQILRVMGEVNLIIATYEPETNIIEIPYAYENQQVISIPPFPLGEGLTSILIKTGKPLLLVEDTENKARELGAKIIGAPAKSWLGVPLLVGGQVIGAIIVQDLEIEKRFDDEDMKMLSTLSTQVAVTLRNARLIHQSRQKAARERQAVEINQKIWSAADIDTILRTALTELGSALHASHGYLQLRNSDCCGASQPDRKV